MATTTSSTDYIRALPTLGKTAEFIGIDASGITRAIQRLNIEPQQWGKREKHLTIADVLRIAVDAQRASLEEVAGALLDWAEGEHPELAPTFAEEIDAFFDALPAPTATEPDAFVAELRAALPKRWAAKAEKLWNEHRHAAQLSSTK